MRSGNQNGREKSTCSVRNMPVPDFLDCPNCGAEIEIWTDEEETLCLLCSYRLFKKESIIH